MKFRWVNGHESHFNLMSLSLSINLKYLYETEMLIYLLYICKIYMLASTNTHTFICTLLYFILF